jgi:hypothetical protein
MYYGVRTEPLHLEQQVAEELTLQLGITDHEAVTHDLVAMMGLGMARDLVVRWRLSWTGSPKPLSHRWAGAIGMFGGAATPVRIAQRLGQSVAQFRSARNARVLGVARPGTLAVQRFAVACKAYDAWLRMPPQEAAQRCGVLRQEIGLYSRRLSRAVAELGFTSLDTALAEAPVELHALFNKKYDLTPALLNQKWTESPPLMWRLPQPSWWRS